MNRPLDNRMGSEDTGILGRLLADNTVLNKGTDDELKCYGYCDSKFKRAVFHCLTVATLGLLLLVLHWKPELECYLKKTRCALYKADTVLLQDLFNHKYVSHVKSFNIEEELSELTDAYNREETLPENQLDVDDVAQLTVKQTEPVVCYFDHQYVRFLWSDAAKTFSPLRDISSNTKCSDLHEHYHGLSAKQQAQRRIVHGENSIEVEVKSYFRLLIEEVLNPFYIFQIASIVLWSIDDYYFYASCILFISCISIGVSLYETKKQMITLHNMVSTVDTSISVSRGDGSYGDITISELVPGDVIVIPAHGCTMCCDAVLMAGTCIVNESMLTGESVPVTKTPLAQLDDDEIYSPDAHKRNTLFAGTKIVQTRYYGQAKVLAVVVRTEYQTVHTLIRLCGCGSALCGGRHKDSYDDERFSTAKGELVRAILFPKPLGFKFYQDAMKFILFLSCIAFFGMAYSVYVYIHLGAAVHRIILRVLDIITIIVPPALPAAMTVGTVYAQSRLKKKKIFCISPPRINFCGRLNLFCFDKTGTLTEDGLDMWGFLPLAQNRFSSVVRDPSVMGRDKSLIGMATCHSLTIIDGDINGDPLDLIMFSSTKWTLDEPGQDTSKFDAITPTVVRPSTKESYLFGNDDASALFEVGIVRQFTFSSSIQRMSVITRTLGDINMEVYCKGAPEKIASLCDQSTVPEDFQEILHLYTIQGFRVIALAWRPLDPKITWHQAQRLSRDKVENDLRFLGLIVMQNKLKRETKPVIRILTSAKVRSVMITGDMIKTAICVSRDCGMVDLKDHVIIVNAQPPDNDGPARIEWEYAETPGGDSPADLSENEETPFLTNMYQLPNKHADIEFSTYKYTAATQITTNVSLGVPTRTHLAVCGRSFSVINTYFPELLPKVCVMGTVFARMLPDQKCQLIEILQGLGYSVGMCGDGANDCEALKAAHAGISLSEAEASVAAPFTSQVNNIECVVTLMREGRSALVTSFGCFKYMALYSFIQFISIMILYTYGVNLSDLQFLYIDLVITTTIAILMGYTKAYHKLVAARPEGSLVKLTNILSILLQVFCVGIFQIAALEYLKGQSWYMPVVPTEDMTTVQCWESTVIFLVSSFQYIVVAFCYSKGPPFRKPIYTNIPYVVSLLALVAFSSVLLLVPWEPFINAFKLETLNKTPFKFRGLIFVLVAGHFVAAFIIEYLVTDNNLVKSCLKYLRRKKSKSQYKRVEKELSNSDWPPMGQVTYMSANHHEVEITVDSIQVDGSINYQ